MPLSTTRLAGLRGKSSVSKASNGASLRWVQLGLGLLVILAISSPQYTWTLFTKPFQVATGATLPAVQVTFTLVIILQTWFSPLRGWLIDRFGSRHGSGALRIARGSASLAARSAESRGFVVPP
jgi:hypothetical protein